MPTAPNITVTDNEDGTATVSVSGSDSGSTNTVYSAFSYGGEWVSRGSRSNDGDVEVTIQPGIYLWHVVSTVSSDSAISNVVMSRVSSGVDPVYQRILEQVQATIRSLSLTGLGVDDIILHTIPQRIQRASNRYILVCPYGSENYTPIGGRQTTRTDDIGYPVLAAFIVPANRDPEAVTKSPVFQWRQDISRTFRSQRLEGVPECYRVNPSYRDAVDRNAWFDSNLFIGGMLLNCTAREGRSL